MMKKKTQVNKRRFKGMVVSDKMDKTAVVRIDRMIEHPKYGKRYIVGKRLKAHDETNAVKIGDEVEIEEMAPKSKDKRWRIVNK